jgi:hypothetical protein
MSESFLGILTDLGTDAVTEAGTPNFVGSSLLAIGMPAADALRVAGAIAQLVSDVGALALVRSQDDFCRLLHTWGDDIVELAAAALGTVAPPGMSGEELAEVLVIEIIKAKFGRLATMLTVAGAIVDGPGIGSHFDRERLRDLLLDGPGVVSEDFWDSVVDAASPVESGGVPALLAALLVLVPQSLAVGDGKPNIAGLVPPPVGPDGSDYWRRLRDQSTGWLSVTLPLETRDNALVLPRSSELVGGFSPEVAMSLLFRSQRRSAVAGNVTDFEMWVYPSVDAPSFVRPIGDGFVRVEPSVPLGFGYDGTTGSWNAAIAPRPGSPVSAATNDAVISLGKNVVGAPDLTFGPPDETRLTIRDLGLDLHLREVGEPSVELIGRAHGFGVVLTNRWFRSLGLGSLVRDGLTIDADIDARFAEGAGFSLAADGALATRLSLGKSIGARGVILTIHTLVLRVPVRADEEHFDIRLEALPHWSLKVGPVTLVMDGAGAWLGWWADPPGGAKQCVGLVPPTGLGLELDLPGVVAGGFIDYTGGTSERYGGVLSVKIAPSGGLRGVTVTAFGVHELSGREGDVDRQRTLILVLGTRFDPGVAFGPGIIWVGVGGLYGHNRRADTNALRERLTSGAVGNVLFADDPVRNAPVLLGDLAALFPPAAGVYVLGLTAQFGWTPMFGDYLVRAAVGVLVEFEGDRLTKVVVLGSLIVHLPAGPGMSQAKLDKLLNIQVDVIGVVDRDRKTVAIDLTIRQGRFLEIFTLSGDGGFRASWGDQRYLMATLGGFHPDFHPQPAVFPKLKRILLAIKDEDLPGPIDKLSVSAYLAVTTNTIQFGAELTAEISSGNWSIEGKIGGDALIGLPFSFNISIHGGVHVTYRGHSLIGVDFKGGITGPSPIMLSGEVCVSLLLFDACWSGSIQLGGGTAVGGPVIASLIALLADELDATANLSAGDADDRWVLATSPQEATRPVLSPMTAPVWSQNRVPLGVPIETFEAGHLDTPQRLTVTASHPTTPHRDWFTPGAFVELSDAEEMALPSFEQFQAGVVVTAAATRSTSVTAPFIVEEIRIPGPPIPKPGFTLPEYILDRLGAIDAPVSLRPQPRRFELADPAFLVGVAGAVETVPTAVQARLAARPTRAVVQHAVDRLVSL